MAATDTTVLGDPPEGAEPLLGRIMAAALFALFLVMFSINQGAASDIWSQAPHLLVWVLLVLIMNLLPVTVNDIQLTLDLPLLMAAAMLYGPESAALVGFLATVDSRQLSGEGLSPWRSLFNRSQVALSIWVAGSVFDLLSPGLLPLTRSVPALAFALLADYLVNTVAVAIHVAVTRRIEFRESARRLVEHPLHFVATYLGYAGLSLVLAMLYERVGLWSVVAFLLPLFGARQLLLKGRTLERLADDLRRHEVLLRRALDQVASERRNERMRIAADLHDDVLQSLIHVRMLGSLLENELCRSLSLGPEAKELSDARDLRVSAERAIDGLRTVIAGLSSSELEANGLVASLRQLLGRLQRDWRVEIVAKLPPETNLEGDIDLVIYQVTREAVLNALKHSGASRVEVTLTISAEKALLDVQDDGVGFIANAVDPQRERHFGLRLIRSRVESISGQMSVDSYPGKGTRLRASIPLRGGREARSPSRFLEA